MLILSIVSHLHQLMIWSSGISLSTLGWEPWLEVVRVPSEGHLCPPEKTLGWLVCLPVAWALCCPFLDRYDATELLCPLCAPKRWPPHMSPSWWFICGESMEFQGNLTEETFRGKRSNHTWHHMPGPGSPYPCPPTTTLSQKQGTSLPFLLSSSLAGLVFLMRLYLYIMGDWVLFIFFQRQKNLIHVSSVESPKTHVIYETLRGQAHLTSSYPRTWEPFFPIPKLHLPFEPSIKFLSTREPLRVTWVLADHSL